ncbi:MAG TPA: hypothetical protein PLN63_02425 [Paludibacteraceae bacterium]|jgi:hypothetical protein|nr:hypothetical protein [Paludibacteraceae bacterium]HOU67943.1 hypothetical protein [Paludibacteraceae bacterium]HPH62468.1 hypothetical protein [Paludibacteraceae bacterium]HQF49862.1 hypothetical protein [Paludibacteraceae bacterium]HQJ89594.1 hypothetical protein [Paludibacteraceae bacterium]
MKRIKVLAMAMMMLLPTAMFAVEADTTGAKVEFSAGADLVSSYVWRGSRVTGASFQPAVGISYAGFSLGAWGSSDFKNMINEADFTLGYEIGGFSACVTDYFGPYVDTVAPKYFESKAHIMEATVGFDFASVTEKFPLSIAVNTNFLNDLDEEDEERYSTYIELGYPVTAGDVELAFALGLTPAKGMYSDNLNVVNISIKGSKVIKVTDEFSLPVFSQVVLNPYTESIYMIFGLSL